MTVRVTPRKCQLPSGAPPRGPGNQLSDPSDERPPRRSRPHGLVAVDDDHFHDRVACSASWATRRRPTWPTWDSTPSSTAAGIVASDGTTLRLEKGMGLVDDVFSETPLRRLPGDGRVRYSTAGDTVATNAQPYLIECHRGPAVARRQPGQRGDPPPGARGGGLDLPVHVGHRGHPPSLRPQRERLEDAIAASLCEGDGRAFSLLFPRRPRAFIATRDPWGFRPLVIGRLERGRPW